MNKEYLEKLTDDFERRRGSHSFKSKKNILNILEMLQYLKISIYESLVEKDLNKAKRWWDRYNRIGYRITKLANSAIHYDALKQVIAFIETANEIGFKELVIYDNLKVDWIEDLDNILSEHIIVGNSVFLKRIFNLSTSDLRTNYPWINWEKALELKPIYLQGKYIGEKIVSWKLED